MDKALIIYFILLSVSALAIKFAFYCLKQAGEAFLYAAQLTSDRGLRSRFSRKAVVAGNKLAYPIYALSIPEEFEEHKPMKPFKFKGVRCVFSGYYFADKYKNSISQEQWDFSSELLEYKNGYRNGIEFFQDGMDALQLDEECVVMFMPCSTFNHYRKRFQAISYYIEDFFPESANGYGYITFTGQRESLHQTKGRKNKKLERNYFINKDLSGMRIIVVDDLLTTGKSLLDFKSQIEDKGGKVVGAVFMGKTFSMPSNFEIRFAALCGVKIKRKETGDSE